MMKWILKFYSSNKLLSKVTAGASVIIILYELSRDLPEWFVNADRWFLLAYQFSMAIVGSCIFYIIQSYIPQERRKKRLRLFICREYREIGNAISFMFKDISEIYIGKRKNPISITDDELYYIAEKLRNKDEVTTQILGKGYMSVEESLTRCKYIVREHTNNIKDSYIEVLEPEEIELVYCLQYGKMNEYLNADNKLYSMFDVLGDTDRKFEALKECREQYIDVICMMKNSATEAEIIS